MPTKRKAATQATRASGRKQSQGSARNKDADSLPNGSARETIPDPPAPLTIPGDKSASPPATPNGGVQSWAGEPAVQDGEGEGEVRSRGDSLRSGERSPDDDEEVVPDDEYGGEEGREGEVEDAEAGLTLEQKLARRERKIQELEAQVGAKDHKIQRIINEKHEQRMQEGKKYPLSKPSFPDGGDWEMAPLRHILGLRNFAGTRGEVNRFIMNESHSEARGIISMAMVRKQLDPSLEWKKLGGERQTILVNQYIAKVSRDNLYREVFFVKGNAEKPKFKQHWPVEQLLMTALTTESANREAYLEEIQGYLKDIRAKHRGLPGWIGKNIRWLNRKSKPKRTPGRPKIGRGREASVESEGSDGPGLESEDEEEVAVPES
ncbi:hypothetical protein QFC20_003381 [Naganishia adeliensis]|uniref:Uncharacterized protein n=1 Tax=Naganishia adeliensis TaxID=92952 RepID=A0ACC2W9L9_9TREE|nr:hypothetical protein QFC20_003381 [Naganishia adeliensis]